MKKSRVYFLVLIGVISIFSLHSQDIETDPLKFDVDFSVVKVAKSQFELNEAAYVEYQRADATLNYVYQQILREYSGNELFLENLVEAQKSWIVYRDNHLESIFPGENKRLDWGSMYPMTYGLEMADITWERVRELHRWLLPDNSHGSFGKYNDWRNE